MNVIIYDGSSIYWSVTLLRLLIAVKMLPLLNNYMRMYELPPVFLPAGLPALFCWAYLLLSQLYTGVPTFL